MKQARASIIEIDTTVQLFLHNLMALQSIKLKLEAFKFILSRNMDLWQLYIKVENLFRNLTTKSRSPHLRDKKIKLTEYNPKEGTITAYWNLIYPDWVKEPITKKLV